MLPPGHVAAGYLVAHTFLKLAHPDLSVTDQNLLLCWGIFFSFAPDLDSFFAFAKAKKWAMGDEHRKFYSHAPVNWLVGGLAISLLAFLFHNVFYEYFGILVWLGSWTHFTLDSVQYGIMWLWPWKRRIIALRDREMKVHIEYRNFFQYWIEDLKVYMTRGTLSFCLELAIIITALVVYLR